MGRKRTKDRDLPPRMYRKHGAFWHVSGGKWRKLAGLDDTVTAFARYAELETGGTGRTLQDAINRFVAEYIPTKAPGTQPDYRAICLRLADWGGHLRADEITSPMIARLLDEYPSPARANKVVAVLSSVFSRMRRWGWEVDNPCLNVPRNPVKRRNTVPTWDEIERVKGVMPERWRAMVDLALFTALRRGDMLELKWGHCTDEGLRAGVSKTGDVRIFAWSPGLRDAVERLRSRCDWLCANTKGERYTPDGFSTQWKRYRAKAGLDHIWWHDLRARALTDAEIIGGKEYAQALAAHASVTTTERYLRGRRQAIEPLDIRQRRGY